MKNQNHPERRKMNKNLLSFLFFQFFFFFYRTFFFLSFLFTAFHFTFFITYDSRSRDWRSLKDTIQKRQPSLSSKNSSKNNVPQRTTRRPSCFQNCLRFRLQMVLMSCLRLLATNLWPNSDNTQDDKWSLSVLFQNLEHSLWQRILQTQKNKLVVDESQHTRGQRMVRQK